MKMIINGAWTDAFDKGTFDVFNPANGEYIDSAPFAREQDVELAVAAAKKAQKIWAKVPIYDKGEILMRFVAMVERDKEELAKLLSAESGKPIREARAEIANIPIAFKGFVERAKHLYGEVIPNGVEAGQEHHLVMTVREPIGVIACIIPFNFPCDLFDQKVAPTLLAGNAAIVKPPEDNPLTLCRLTGMLNEAGVTPGALQILTGKGSVAGAALCAHPDVHAITLTGSTEVGIITYKKAAERLAHVSLELGGNDAFVLFEDGDVDLAVEEMIWGRMYNCGQVCCASKRYLIHNSRREEFVKKAVERIKKLKVGNPAEESTDIACLISEKAAKGVEEQVKLTIEQGGKLVLGGTRNGAFYAPTVIDDIPKTADVMTDLEIFGPVVSVTGFDTEEEAIALANASRFGLCGCVFTEDMKRAFRVASQLECGGVVLNGASFYRSFEMPFGGYKDSGIGTEGVMSTFDEVTRTKNIVLKNIL